MPIPLLSPRKRNQQVPPLDTPTTPSSETPGHLLFDIRSTDTESRKLNLFRRVFSSSHDALSSRPSNALATRRSSLMPPNYAPMFTMPPIEIVRADPRKQWSLHTISIPDNGLKNQIIDMYTILADMEQRPMHLTMPDIDLFYAWFRIFYSIMEEIFFLEESCLYSWMEGTDNLSEEKRKWGTPTHKITGPLSEVKRVKCKGDILRLAREVRLCKDQFGGKPILQTLPEMANAIKEFVTQLISYLDKKKTHLPECINKRLKIHDRSRYEKHYWNSARKTESPAYLVIAITSWMNRRERRRWKSKYFLVKGKGIYGKWNKVYLSKYYEIVLEFSRRVTEAEAERQNNEKVNEMARARAVQPSFQNETASYTDDDVHSRTLTSCASSIANSSVAHLSIATNLHAREIV